jgi:cellulose synthase/poly-beta-1,6-N-acetylglucosamine synthase-like glycosyltransferase
LRGAQAIQASSSVLNVEDSWRTRLMALGFALFNQLRSLARENLGLSCGVRGNGICLSTALLREHPHQAVSLVEDVEYGIVLGRAGVRVEYADEVKVKSAMVSSGDAAAPQRRRWELGRFALARRLALPLLGEALAKRSLLLLDLAIDLFVPPLSLLALAVVFGCIASIALGTAVAPWLACLAFLAIYGMRGWQLSGIGLGALFFAPVYVFWKLAVLARGSAGGWVRTAREGGAR